jgi:hypothetical protein
MLAPIVSILFVLLQAICWILLAVGALILLVLLVPFGVVIHKEEETQVTLRWAFLRFPLLPAKENKKTKRAKKTKPREKKEKKKEASDDKKENVFLRYLHNEGVRGYYDLLRRTVAYVAKFGSGFAHSFVMRRFYLRLVLPGDEPQATAVKYGKTSAAIFPALGFLKRHLRWRHCSIDIHPDFTGWQKKETFLHMHVTVSLGRLLCALLVFGCRFGFGVALRFLRDAKAEEPPTAHPRPPAPQFADEPRVVYTKTH